MQLHRETLCSLESGTLGRIAGGTVANTNCSICITCSYCATRCHTCNC
ncbi:MAG: hypothetical protein JOZ15_15300 [Acidobacteria bacterium]|nr:hypothetical protein [Acidobacteriota bacterium]